VVEDVVAFHDGSATVVLHASDLTPGIAVPGVFYFPSLRRQFVRAVQGASTEGIQSDRHRAAVVRGLVRELPVRQHSSGADYPLSIGKGREYAAP
jgi:hypothetical protein